MILVWIAVGCYAAGLVMLGVGGWVACRRSDDTRAEVETGGITGHITVVDNFSPRVAEMLVDLAVLDAELRGETS